MPTAIINQPDLSVRLSGERLEVFCRRPETGRDESLREIPLRDLDRLILSESVHMTAPALAAVLRAGIPIQFFSWAGRFLGNFLPAQNHHGLARLRQYQRTLDPAFSLPMAGRLVTAKLYNQRRVLQRLHASRGGSGPQTPPTPSSGASQSPVPPAGGQRRRRGRPGARHPAMDGRPVCLGEGESGRG
ncbi:MAG: CRISPR-associated endonuclease Cas1 [Verrucomicrobia bacterium]|nr:CRISPR-associated endonuclease Cas1 [Verrucomicrobiota bacterium]